MTTARANFTGLNDGLHAEEITWEEYLSACAGSLADAKLVPLDYLDRPGEFVTLTSENKNGRQ